MQHQIKLKKTWIQHQLNINRNPTSDSLSSSLSIIKIGDAEKYVRKTAKIIKKRTFEAANNF